MLLRSYEQTNFITGLRALAVLGVFLIHSGGGGLRELSPMWNTFVDWGKYGVDVFFVISGYTIFYQIFHAKYNVKYFLMQRITRISAPYWPLLLLLFLTGIMGVSLGSNHGAEGLEVTWQNWLLHALYLNFWNVAYSNTIIGVEWTLSIEVFYYMLLGTALTMMVLRNIFVSFVLLSFALLCVAVIGFYVMTSPLVGNSLNIHWSPLLYGYMFALGGVAFFVRRKVSEIYSQSTKNSMSDISFLVCFLLFGINLIYSIVPNSPAYAGFLNFIHASFLFPAGLPFVFACLTTLLIAFMQDDSVFGKFFTLRPIIFLGSISYSFYLWHFLILHTEFLQVNWSNSTLNFFYLLFLSIVVSFCWYYVFEKKAYGKIKMMIKRYQ